eukprot:6169253-Pleurochrysis_carterae.AAC.1
MLQPQRSALVTAHGTGPEILKCSESVPARAATSRIKPIICLVYITYELLCCRCRHQFAKPLNFFFSNTAQQQPAVPYT